MQIKRALSIHIHKQVLIKIDKQIEFLIHEITTESNQIIMQIQPWFRNSPLAKGGISSSCLHNKKY